MATDYLATCRLPQRTGNDHPIGSPYGLFRTADGEIAIAPAGEAMYQRLLRALDAETLRERPEFATNALRAENRAAINAEIEARTSANQRALDTRAERGRRAVLAGDEPGTGVRRSAGDRSAGGGDGRASGAWRGVDVGSALHIDGAPLPVRRPAPELANTMWTCWTSWVFPPADRSAARTRGGCEVLAP